MVSLFKIPIVLLVAWTAFVGAKLAWGSIPPLGVVLWTLLGLIFVASGASTLNNLIDRDIDKVMLRTKMRPLVSGKVSARAAFSIAIFFILSGLLLLFVKVNTFATLLTGLSLILYVPIYTLYKRRSPQSVILGSFIGALPPLIGYVSVKNSLSLDALILALLLFLWQPPHFLALSLTLKGDYFSAKIPIFPLVYTEFLTKLHILSFGVGLFLITNMLMFIINVHSHLVLLTVLLSFLYILLALLLIINKISGRFLFRYSIIYLILVLTPIVVHP